MKLKDVKIGMRVKCVDASDSGGWIEQGKEYTILQERYGEIIVDADTCGSWMLSRFEPVEQPFPLANTKINVQKYADENGISLEQAHKEIQPWLFEQGYLWCEAVCVSFTNGRHLYVEEDNTLAYGSDNHFFLEDDGKEITLSRKVTVELTPSFVEPAVEYVELGGKRYVKAELEEALSKIKAVEE